MTIRVGVTSSTGKKNDLHITEDNAALTTFTGIPPEVSSTALKPFSILFSRSNGDTSMLVDGSVTEIDFFLPSSSDGDRYINTLAFTIADAGSTFNKFGNIAALTNGCELILQDSKLGDVTIATALKSNFDFVQLANFEPAFGDGAAAFKGSNVEGASEAYFPVLDIEDVFGIKYGLLIKKDSPKKLILRIKDNVSGIDRFDVRAFGNDVITMGDE